MQWWQWFGLGVIVVWGWALIEWKRKIKPKIDEEKRRTGKSLWELMREGRQERRSRLR
jgi:hypothetical protein